MSTFDKHDLSGFIGKHLVYTYDNGWNYEIYVKNGTTLDYRIHSGIVANRWVKDQHAYIVRVGESIYKISWTEPTGTDVSLIVNLGDKLFHGTIFFPRWIMNNPEKTVCFQNDHIPLMNAYRDAGPAYPTEVIDGNIQNQPSQCTVMMQNTCYCKRTGKQLVPMSLLWYKGKLFCS